MLCDIRDLSFISLSEGKASFVYTVNYLRSYSAVTLQENYQVRPIESVRFLV